MKRYIYLPLLAIVLLAGTALAETQSENGQPFAALWEAIEDLQEQIDNLDLGGGDGGIGAGDIAFCRVEKNCRTVLRTDGTVWDWNDRSGWFPTLLQPDFVPIPVEDIILWNQFDLLDNNGDVWVWGFPINGQWNNVGHP